MVITGRQFSDKKQKETIELQQFTMTLQEDRKDSKRRGRCFQLIHQEENKSFEVI